ncbi:MULTISPECIES: MarR family winged helix-turn-helix transcriptional regulator [Euryhalocaulis]|uniref:MarR family winged helix-turn-helix transcriptional regulator n=1 Tax=Euryhalocaulis TaxID=1712422 RepID=UPI0003A9FAEE|nr:MULTISPECIES: MarR family transcriptional regulator [Euryhalocaulis]MBA4801377.1 MarR family transcriptional regulator [Euryhalocaulis sp.]
MADHDDILIALRRITRAIDLRSRQLLKETGLTAPQLVVIQTLRRQGPMPASALARQVSLSQATVTTILDRLGKAELVTRSRTGSDRRVVTVALTESGAACAAEAPELLQAGFLSRLNTLESWERHMLVASLQRIAAMMDAEDLDAAPFLEVGDIARK